MSATLFNVVYFFSIFKFKPVFKQHVNLMIWTWIFVYGLKQLYDRYSCIETYSYSFFTHCQIHVQIRRFTCCLKMSLNLKIHNMSPELFALRGIQKALRTSLIILPMLLFAKTLRTALTLWWRYDVRKFTADAILLRESKARKGICFMF